MKQLLLILAIIFSVSITQAQRIYKTPSGKKYHAATCKMVENVSKEITHEEASRTGLQPCKICKPGLIQGISSSSKTASGVSEGVQCKGITKSKTRCRHVTRIANGYCYQHVGQAG